MPENIRNIIYRFSQELRRILGDKLTKIMREEIFEKILI